MARPKNKGKNKLTTILVISFLAVLLFSLDIGGFLGPIRSKTDLLLNPVRYWFTRQGRSVSTFFRDISSISSLRSENSDLKRQVYQLESDLTSLSAVKKENDDLRAQLEIPDRTNYEIIQSHIIGGDLQSLNNSIIVIDAGSKDGVAVDDVGVFSKYLVGKITEVSENSSVLTLFLSSNLEIPVISEKNRTKGLVKGDVNTGLIMEKVLREEVLEVDEKILTSGIGGFPEDLIVGSVQEVVGNDADVEKKALLTNAIDLKDIEELFVLHAKEN